MAANQTRGSRPYRKASEYLVTSNKAPVPAEGQPQLMQENEVLHQKLMATSRKLEHAEAEFAQSREYFETQLDISHDREFKLNEQCRRLQSSYASLQATNRELEHKISMVNQLQAEKDLLVREVNELSNKLTESRNAIFKMQEENERLRKDCNTAVQLLKCNQSTFQVKRSDQLPGDIQDRVHNYRVELQNYNEYINPYASDSGSDDDVTQSSRTRNVPKLDSHPKQKVEDNGVPVEFIAEALKKPENVHLNLEPSDYIQDPALHSVYKAHYVERKLIKPDYGKKEAVSAASHPKESYRNPSSHVRQQRQTPVSEEVSPWELAPSRRGMPRFESSGDDESPAGAYGAYSLAPKRKPRPKSAETPSPIKEKARYQPSRYDPKESYSISPRSPSPEDLTFRAPIQPSKTGLGSFFTKPSKGSPAISLSSSSSSKKSTPLKVRGKEAATSAETSSLLNQTESDEEGVMVEISHYSKNTSPNKSYMADKTIGEEGGALLATVEEPTDLPPPSTEIELEWDPEVGDETLTDNSELIKETEKLSIEEEKPQSDFLLSYTDVESPKKSIPNDLEELISTPEHESFLQLNKQQYLPPPNPGGQLLSEIVTNNPSLSNFLMSSTPPPPKQFATSSEPPDIVLPDGGPGYGGGEVESSFPVRVDEQIEVIDLDEEPRKRRNRRRNSFDQAQEFGNILNL